MIPYGLAIGADTSQSSPNNALEYSAAAGGAAFIVGNKKEEIVAGLEYTASFTSDTPDFWRRGTQQYPSHAGRFTGEPAYFKHVVSATKQLFDETGYKPEDFDHAVFHQPNGKFPMHVSKVLGFSKEQVLTGLMVPVVGNTYSGASMLGLAAVLDQAQPNQKILVTSYGSGSGSDSFVFNTTDLLTTKQSKARTTLAYVARKKYVSYAKYRQNMEFIH
jgi:hydroxymethylglutaryl-CoA synthase